MKNFLKWFFRLLPLLYMGLIWTLSSMPADAVVELPDSKIDAYVKESLHLIEFAILYLLFVMAAFTTGTFSEKLSITFAVISCLYGALDEIHQSFVPYRSATWIDLVKDVTGVLAAYYFVRRGYRRNAFDTILNYFHPEMGVSKVD
ncbi:VanZ family protein [Bacillus dakarensis]|uniref:VanZ family protein n=1 Tax=Robertmurraya dakarensis TaxID=1926278 RepID=UPI000980A7D8|nr:VanZ family protein [Bacillus dakarensis]